MGDPSMTSTKKPTAPAVRRANGEPVPAVIVSAEMRAWRDDRLRGKVPKTMSFAQYVARYLGWKVA